MPWLSCLTLLPCLGNFSALKEHPLPISPFKGFSRADVAQSPLHQRSLFFLREADTGQERWERMADGWVSSSGAGQCVCNCEQLFTKCEASIGREQPYRRQKASWYAPLCRVEPYRSSGIAMIQLDAPSSIASSAECSSAAGNSDFSAVATS